MNLNVIQVTKLIKEKQLMDSLKELVLEIFLENFDEKRKKKVFLTDFILHVKVVLNFFKND